MKLLNRLWMKDDIEKLYEKVERIQSEIVLIKQSEERAWHESMERFMADLLDQTKHIIQLLEGRKL